MENSSSGPLKVEKHVPATVPGSGAMEKPSVAGKSRTASS